MRRFARRACFTVTSMTMVLAGLFVAIPAANAQVSSGSGTGPYPAIYETDFRLPNHTVYRPRTLPTNTPLPIVVWGNGACRADGTWFDDFLLEIASHGFLVVANGNPGGSGQTQASWLTDGIDWAVRENSRLFGKYRGRLDTTRIAAMGQSCGGLEAIEVSSDPRITTSVIWNSGLFGTGPKPELRELHAPVAYITGGESDIAHANALDDWSKLPPTLPAFLGSLDVGHFGTYGQTNGGEFAQVGKDWLKWQLKGDQTARQRFVGPSCGLCTDPDWDVQQRNLG